MSEDPPAIPIKLVVNGVERRDEVEPRLLLVHLIRERLGLTGTHVGCDTTQCGACTVMLDGAAVKSCTLFAAQADGCRITTIEGLATNGQLHPVQQAFCDHHGLQCGFCTPGFVMAGIQLIERYPTPSDAQIRHQLDGNICRCTGYRGIVRAIQDAAGRMQAFEPAADPPALPTGDA